MALPPGVTTCTVFKNAPVSFGGGQAKVLLEVTPSVRLIHTATGIPLADFIEVIEPPAGAVAQAALPHTSQDGFQDEAGNSFKNWHYTAKIRYEKDGKYKHLPLITFQIPAGQTAPIDLSLVPAGPAAMPTSAPIAVVTSLNGATGAVDTYLQLARSPELLITGPITRDTGGAPMQATVTWPDETTGIFTGEPSEEFPGSIDSYTITYGDSRIYTQPAVTRDAAGNITNQPAITEEPA